MTEQTSPPGPGEPTRTGVPAVDAALSGIEDLDELPLDQHLATFERAHEALRSALEAPADQAADDPVDPGLDQGLDQGPDPASDEPA